MRRKLFIVNNGLKDLRGHYFETSAAVAEAAASAGLEAVLGAHASCPDGLAPDGLDFHPLFCTDHWMLHPPAPPPELPGVRGDFTAWARSGESLAEYLAASFLLPDPTPVPPPPGRLERLKALARGSLPPAVAAPLRWLYRRRTDPLSFAKKVARSFCPPALWGRLRAARSRFAPEAEQAPVWRDPLERRLDRWGARHEYDYMLAFRRDLERFLVLGGCTAADHVLLPTAHSRELIAIQRLVSNLGEGQSPTFHLEFRHATDIPAAPHLPHPEHPYCAGLRAFFDEYRGGFISDKIRLYTDTEELADDYRDFSGLPFGVLPIPFRAGLIRPRQRHEGDPICIAFFGDVRDEKGFYLLAPLAEALLTNGADNVRFLVQATLVHPEWDRKSAAALRVLERFSAEQVTLVGRDGPLAPADYYALVSEADMVVCPYAAASYRSRSSGTLAEAIAAGLPTVTPRGTWLARQQPPGAGEVFHDSASFIDAVRRICTEYSRYRTQALAQRAAWVERHSPERLVAALLASEPLARPRAA